MNKEFLEELFKIKFGIQQRVEHLKAQTREIEGACLHCDRTSGDVIRAELRAMELAELTADKTITLYMEGCV